MIVASPGKAFKLRDCVLTPLELLEQWDSYTIHSAYYITKVRVYVTCESPAMNGTKSSNLAKSMSMLHCKDALDCRPSILTLMLGTNRARNQDRKFTTGPYQGPAPVL